MSSQWNPERYLWGFKKILIIPFNACAGSGFIFFGVYITLNIYLTQAVWKHFFNVCERRAGLEEELDMLRVQAAMDRATVKELHLCLANEHQGEPFFLHFGEVTKWTLIFKIIIIIHSSSIYFSLFPFFWSGNILPKLNYSCCNFTVLLSTMLPKNVATGLKNKVEGKKALEGSPVMVEKYACLTWQHL